MQVVKVPVSAMARCLNNVHIVYTHVCRVALHRQSARGRRGGSRDAECQQLTSKKGIKAAVREPIAYRLMSWSVSLPYRLTSLGKPVYALKMPDPCILLTAALCAPSQVPLYTTHVSPPLHTAQHYHRHLTRAPTSSHD